MNFLYDDIVHVLQNTIDSCINSATDRRGGYVLERMFTKFSETTQCNGHYAVQGHSRLPILVPIESSSTTSYWLILTYILSCTVSKLWLIIRQIFASERGVPHFNAIAWGSPANIAINDISLTTTFLGISAAESIHISSTTFMQSAQKATEFGEIKQPLSLLRRSRSFKVTESKAHMRLPISD